MAEVWDKAEIRPYPKVPGKERTAAYFVWLEEDFPVWATSKARSSARKIETIIMFVCMSFQFILSVLLHMILFFLQYIQGILLSPHNNVWPIWPNFEPGEYRSSTGHQIR